MNLIDFLNINFKIVFLRMIFVINDIIQIQKVWMQLFKVF